LFVTSLKKSRREPFRAARLTAFRWNQFFKVAAVFVGSSALFSRFIGALQPFASIIVILSYAVMGIGLFMITTRRLFSRSWPHHVSCFMSPTACRNLGQQHTAGFSHTGTEQCQHDTNRLQFTGTIDTSRSYVF